LWRRFGIFHKESGGLGNQPVRRQPSDAYQDTNDRQKWETNNRQRQGVTNAIQQGLANRRPRAEVGSGYPNPDGLIEELEIGADPEATEVVAEIEPENV
jgi:hypothetical protein